jgi:hypothetical protein
MEVQVVTMSTNEPSRLDIEIEGFQSLTTEELNAKRIEFQEVRIIIQHDLLTDRADIDKEWKRKAVTAYKINGVKIAAIDTIIGARNSGKKKYYKVFTTVAKEVLPKDILEVIEETVRERLNKVLS